MSHRAKLSTYVILCLLSLLNVGASRAQTGPEVIDVRPYTPLDGTKIESVSMMNGSLNTNIPVWSFTQRGKVKLDFSLSYDTPGYTLTRTCSPTGQTSAQITASLGVPSNVEADPQAVHPDGCNSTGGCDKVATGVCILSWHVTGGDPGFAPDLYQGIRIVNSTDVAVIPVLGYTENTTPGPTNPLLVVTGGYFKLRTPDLGSHVLAQTTSGDWRAIDGTGWEYQPGSCALHDKDGTLYQFSCSPAAGEEQPIFQNYPGALQSITDTNGNTITLNYTSSVLSSWTDSMGRVIPVPLSSPSTDASACPSGSTGALQWSLPGVTNPIVLCQTSVSLQTDFWGADADEQHVEWTGSFTTLSAVTLPTGDTYTFGYTPNTNDPTYVTGVNYGELTSIGLPTGGTIQYYWDRQHEFCGFGSSSLARSMITQRILSAGPNATAAAWSYVIGVTGGNISRYTSTVTDPKGEITIHTLTAVTGCSYYETALSVFDSKNNLLKTSTTAYQATPQIPYIIGLSLYGAGLPTVTNETWPDGTSVQTSIQYDPGFIAGPDMNGNEVPVPYGNQIQKQQYDLSSGSSLTGNLLQTTNTDYWAFDNLAALSANILSAVSNVTVTDASTTRQQVTNYGYDEYPLAAGNADTGWTATPANGLVRGNMTSEARLVSGSSYLTTVLTYTNAGEVSSLTRPANGAISPAETTTYGWSADYHGGELTSVTNALGQSNTYTYYPESYLLETKTDPNHEVTSFAYDGANRLQQVTGPPDPQGNQPVSKYQYPNSNEVDSQVLQAASNWISKEAFYDGLGRPATTQALAGCGAGPINTLITYDQLNRKDDVYNPYCATSDQTYGFTVNDYDALNRQIDEFDQDTTSEKIWRYFDNTTTEIDESSNAWARTVDGLGRLIKVVEPGQQVTTYGYEFNNLLSVMQSGLPGDTARTSRHYSYDLTNRLVASYNPETGSGATCPGASGGFSECYSYDPDDNLQSKTDARGIIVNYTYDALNRVLSKSYSNDPNGTPISCYQYDASTVTNGIGRLSAEWTQPASSGSCTAAPLTGGYITLRQIQKYDSLGRITSETQCDSFIDCSSSTFYSMSYVYDLAGNLLSENNGLAASDPNGMTFTSAYDLNNRLTGVSTQLTSGTPDPVFATAPVNLFQANGPEDYGAIGLLSANYSVNQAAGLPAFQETKSYDVRTRVTQDTYGSSMSPPSSSSGSITVTGTEQSVNNSNASANIIISGLEGSVPHCSIPNNHNPTPVCTYSYDTGDVVITIGTYSVTEEYREGSTVDTLAAAFVKAFNAAGSPVTAVSDGDVSTGAEFTVTSVLRGPAGTYPITITDGTDFDGNAVTGNLALNPNNTVYDSGSVMVSVFGQTSSPVTWGQNWGASDIAGALASALQNLGASSPPGYGFTATLNGETVLLQSTSTGSILNQPIIVSVADTTAGIASPSFVISATGMAGGSDASTGAATTLYQYSIPTGGYAANSNLLSYTDTVTGSWSLGYDGLNRLTGGSNTAVGSSSQYYCWYYDSFGNRLGAMTSSSAFPYDPTGSCSSNAATGTSITVDANNHMTSSSQNVVLRPDTYDAAGNQQFDVVLGPGNTGDNQYLYDAEGRVCAVSNFPVSGGTQFTGYVYDAGGTRVAKGTLSVLSCDPSTNGFAQTNTYVNDLKGDQVTEVANGSWKHSNVFTVRGLMATYDTLGLHYHLSDWLGTRRVQTDPFGQVEQTCWSLPFGDGQACTSPTGAPTTADDATEHHFTGKERDSESGLDYFGARYYASSMGRWMSPDPGKIKPKHLANPQKWNMYNYVLNNPLSMIDPDGQQEVTITYRAFIPMATVFGFRGDNRSFSTNPKASSRVSITVRIETDPTKNGGNPMIGKPIISVGDTHIMGTPEFMNKKSDGPVMPTATASQDSNGNVTVNMNMNMRDPFQPAGQGAASNVGITVNESATSAEVKGTVSGAPSFETNFTPAGAPTTNLPVQSSPTSTGSFLSGLQKTNQVDQKTDLKQAPQ